MMILKTLFVVFGLLLWVAVADAQLIRKDQIDPDAFPNLSEMCAENCHIFSADSPSTALKVGDSVDFIRFYRSASGTLVMRCVIGGVEGACDEGFEIKAGFLFQLCDEFGVCGFKWKPEEPNAFDLSCGSEPATPASNRLKTFCENDLLKIKNDAGTVTTVGADQEFTFSFILRTGSALANGDDRPRIFTYRGARTLHITEIFALTDTGSTTFNIQKNDGSAADICTSDITATTSGVACTTFTSGEQTLAFGQSWGLDVVTAATSGTPLALYITITGFKQ